MAEFEAKKMIDLVRNTPPEIHADIIAMGLYITHLLHPHFSPQAVDFPEFCDGSAPKWLLGYTAMGVVHTYVDQKLVKSNKITSFNRCPKHRVQTLF
jgi:hypothetical protein